MLNPFNLRKFRIIFGLGLSLALLFCWDCSQRDMNANHQSFTKFAVSFDASVRNEPTSGRILLLLSRTNKFSTDENGTPFFGKNVNGLKPGEKAFFNEKVIGYTVRSLKNIPAGDYYARAYLNVYTTFHRSDGHTVKLHMDQGEGQNWRRSPGNLYSQPQKIHFDPNNSQTISINMDKKIPPLPPFKETKWVKYVRIKSKLVSEFWGQPMYIAARVLLPKGFYEHPNVHYPVVYMVGHFPRGHPGYPGGFMEDGGNPAYPLTKAWTSDNLPRMILVRFEHANPYFDDSYGVNSKNVGPYGDALTKELIPYVEKKFRGLGKGYSRLLTGGSTGGWISLAMQVFNSDFFGGTWTFYPDPIDFRHYGEVNLYKDENAYYVEHEWTKVPRPAMRKPDGSIVFTMEQANHCEEVLGDRYRSGGQFAIWDALFAPVAEDGYPKPLFDPWTGKIDHEVSAWAKEHYDVVYYLKKNWPTVGPKLVGKLNIYCGRMDHFYLTNGVYALEDFLKTTKNPHYSGSFTYSPRGGHGWNPWFTDTLDLDPDERLFIEMYLEMAEHIAKNAPKGENSSLWHY